MCVIFSRRAPSDRPGQRLCCCRFRGRPDQVEARELERLDRHEERHHEEHGHAKHSGGTSLEAMTPPRSGTAGDRPADGRPRARAPRASTCLPRGARPAHADRAPRSRGPRAGREPRPARAAAAAPGGRRTQPLGPSGSGAPPRGAHPGGPRGRRGPNRGPRRRGPTPPWLPGGPVSEPVRPTRAGGPRPDPCWPRARLGTGRTRRRCRRR